MRANGLSRDDERKVRESERRRATERTRVLAFYRQVAKRVRPYCETCLSHPSSLGPSGKQRASRWCEGEWNGERVNVYACEAHAKGSPRGYENATSWRPL